jgi:hypothetical protein
MTETQSLEIDEATVKSKLVELLKQHDPVGVLTFRNKYNKSDFLERVRHYYSMLPALGYESQMLIENNEKVVLYYSVKGVHA